jgi:hypothetical protein
MLCIQFKTPVETADYARKREAAIVLMKQIMNHLEKTPEDVKVSEPADRDVVGLCHEAANQICHDMDIVTFLNW